MDAAEETGNGELGFDDESKLIQELVLEVVSQVRCVPVLPVQVAFFVPEPVDRFVNSVEHDGGAVLKGWNNGKRHLGGLDWEVCNEIVGVLVLLKSRKVDLTH